VGQIQRQRIEQELKQLAAINQLEKPVAVDDVFDAQFLPPEVLAGSAK